MESVERGVAMTKFHSSDLAPIRAALRRHLEKFDPRFVFRVDNIDWAEDHCWIRLRMKFAVDDQLVGKKVAGYEVVAVDPSSKRPYTLRKKGREYAAGCRLVHDMKGRHK
jgi:hypothetical protein